MAEANIPVRSYNLGRSALFSGTVILLTLFLCIFLSACSSHKSAFQKSKYIVVIDPAHGGRDLGEVAFDGKVAEKEINLMKAKSLAHYINMNSRFSAILTRNHDEEVALDQRGAFPNIHHADFFISLHTRFDKDPKRYEISTYYVGYASDEKSISAAAHANGTPAQNAHDLNAIINDLIDDDANCSSSRLSRNLQQNIFGNLAYNVNGGVIYDGPRTAPFYLLMGAKMPAVLIETPYTVHSINDKGKERMVHWDYVCEALLEGIEVYLRKQ